MSIHIYDKKKYYNHTKNNQFLNIDVELIKSHTMKKILKITQNGKL